ncbi:hypothetical protein V2J09_004570 [Rumex salicifolius]
MENLKTPFRGIASDVRGRLSCYKQDWLGGFGSKLGIFTPSTYIFFASALPAIAFGEQLSIKTDDSINVVDTLVSSAICGVIQSVIGGQPLVIVGVAEPTVMMYTFLYKFAKGKDNLGQTLFLAWLAWVNVWAALMLMLVATFNVCDIINKLTRIAEELIAMLIAVLFMQEAIKGIKSEFKAPKTKDPTLESSYQYEWLYANGLLAVIFALGLLSTALKSRRARSWRYGTGAFRSFLADFGLPLWILIWTALSYAIPSNVADGIPRRLVSPHYPWEQLYHWTVVKDMGKVPPIYIFGAIIPAMMIAGLFFFEHNVASKMAQQKDFNLKNPSAYHYDIFLLGCMTLVCGLIGVPPSYGLLPQSPMHTKSLAALKKQTIRKKMLESVKNSISKQASNLEIYSNMRDVFIEIDQNPSSVKGGELKELAGLKKMVTNGDGEKEFIDFISEKRRNSFDPETHIYPYLPVRVNEQRVSNLLQSLFLGFLAFASRGIRMIPSSLLWGYFAFMAIDSLHGNQFWERIQLLFVPPSRLHKVMERDHVSFVESVPYRYIMAFTLFQLAYLLACFGVTWIPTGGIIFPLLFFFLLVIRHRIMPMVFDQYHLEQLDAHEYEEVAAIGTTSRRSAGISLSFRESGEDEEMDIPMSGEILDELTTSRGELKIRTMSLRYERKQQPTSSFYARSVSFRDDKHFEVYPEDDGEQSS